MRPRDGCREKSVEPQMSRMGTDGAEVFVGMGGGPDFRLRDRQYLRAGPLRDRGTDKI